MSCEVPDGWTATRLGAVAKCEMGETIIAKDLTGDGIPVFSAATDEKPWGWTSSARKRFTRGTIVIGARGSLGHPRLPDFDSFISTQTTIAVHPSTATNPKFLMYALQAVDLDGRGAKQAIPMLTVKTVNEIALHLPPLAEQHRIAEVLCSVDEALQATNAVIEQARTVKDGVFQRLLASGIDHNRFKSTEIGEIPEAWNVGTVADLGKIVTGKTPSTGSAELWDGGIPFITPGDLSANIAWTRASGRNVSELGAAQVKPVQRGSVLVTCIGSTIGKLGIASTRCVTNQQINAICCSEEISPFVYAVAESLKGTLQNLSGKQAVPIVNKSTFQSIRVPLPPKHEQVAISAIVRSHWDQIETLVRTVATLDAIKASLMAELLTGRKRVSASLPLAAE